jgi:hypothetical protein
MKPIESFVLTMTDDEPRRVGTVRRVRLPRRSYVATVEAIAESIQRTSPDLSYEEALSLAYEDLGPVVLFDGPPAIAPDAPTHVGPAPSAVE